MLIASYFFSDIWVLFGQLDLFIFQWEEVLCSGFDLTVLDPSDRKGTTPFLHELNTLDACWIAVDVWSNSSRCRQESVY